MNKKLVTLVCTCAIVMSLVIVPAEAAAGKQGYAVYRDGVIDSGVISFNWHAGIMDKESTSYIETVVHATAGANVHRANWSAFIDGEVFKGYYEPLSGISNSDRDRVLASARALVSNAIGYTALYQVYYESSNNPNNQSYVGYSDIVSMRCDGVVEYSYELNNIRVYGQSDTTWDVSIWNTSIMVDHAGGNITPRAQARNYMELIDNVA